MKKSNKIEINRDTVPETVYNDLVLSSKLNDYLIPASALPSMLRKTIIRSKIIVQIRIFSTYKGNCNHLYICEKNQYFYSVNSYFLSLITQACDGCVY